MTLTRKVSEAEKELSRLLYYLEFSHKAVAQVSPESRRLGNLHSISAFFYEFPGLKFIAQIVYSMLKV